MYNTKKMLLYETRILPVMRVDPKLSLLMTMLAHFFVISPLPSKQGFIV